VKKSASALVLLLFLSIFMVSLSQIGVVKGQDSSVFIRADGSVEGTDKIQVDGNYYSFIGDIEITTFGYGIFVEKDNIVIDGLGHTLEGNEGNNGINLNERSGVTIKNINFSNCWCGIANFGNNCTIEGNWINGGNIGIQLKVADNSTIIGNELLDNFVDVYLIDSYDNNITGNSIGRLVWSMWMQLSPGDNYFYGNYWETYEGIDDNGDGFGDTPFKIYWVDFGDRNLTCYDNNPLMKPIIVPEFPSWTTIYIRSDGSVEGTDKIQRDGDVYTFISDISGSIVVEKNDIVIDGAGFTLQGTGADNSKGIYVEYRSNITIRNLQIKDFDFGIRFLEASNNTITGNHITRTNFKEDLGIDFGILLGGSSKNSIIGNNITNYELGIGASGSDNNTISENTITNNLRGLDLISSENNTVSGNHIANNIGGIALENMYNSIVENTITNNSNFGIHLYAAGYNNIIGNNITNNGRGILVSICYNNVIHHNNFVNNTNHVETDDSNGIWDNGEEGNYWDNYTGIDNDGDGIGDTPYVIAESNQDNYPLMNWFAIELPPQIMSFEEALEFYSKQKYRLWNSGFQGIGDFEGEPFVTADGLVIGYLCWYAGNGSIYEAVYPSGEVKGEMLRLRSALPSEAYYVWELIFMDASRAWVDARNGDILDITPARFLGTLSRQAALRVINASQQTVEEWDVQKYERTKGADPLDEPTGERMLWRAANGSLYEFYYPIPDYKAKEVLRIQVSNDTEEYIMWEITTETETYYIDARNGIIRLIISNDELSSQHQIYQFPSEAIIGIAAIIIIVIVVATFTLKKRFSKIKATA